METELKTKKNYYVLDKQKHIDKALKYQKEHYEEHKRNMRKYIKVHKKKIVDYNKQYKYDLYHSCEKQKLKQKLKTYHSFFMNGKKETFSSFVGLSSKEYKSYIESLFSEGYDWSTYKKKWRIGHKNRFLDVTNINTVSKFFNYKNVCIEKINQ